MTPSIVVWIYQGDGYVSLRKDIRRAQFVLPSTQGEIRGQMSFTRYGLRVPSSGYYKSRRSTAYQNSVEELGLTGYFGPFEHPPTGRIKVATNASVVEESIGDLDSSCMHVEANPVRNPWCRRRGFLRFFSANTQQAIDADAVAVTFSVRDLGLNYTSSSPVVS